MPRGTLASLLLLCLLLPASALAANDCPEPVKAAAQDAYSSTELVACKREREHGTMQYETKIDDQASSAHIMEPEHRLP